MFETKIWTWAACIFAVTIGVTVAAQDDVVTQPPQAQDVHQTLLGEDVHQPVPDNVIHKPLSGNWTNPSPPDHLSSQLLPPNSGDPPTQPDDVNQPLLHNVVTQAVDTTQPPTGDLKTLQQRVQELELMFRAQEDATRQVIRQSFLERGTKMNDFVTFGGTLEALAGITNDFEGFSESDILLNTCQVDFEIAVNRWTLGSIILEYQDGSDVLFPTNSFFVGGASVDRINVDTAFLVVGDLQQCPIYAKFGRMINPFGISTGDPVADVLNIENPLTVEVFETREDSILIGIDLLRPTPPTQTVMSTPRRAQPRLFAPIFRVLGDEFNQRVNYPYMHLLPTPQPQVAIPACTQYRSNTAVYFYNGNTQRGVENTIQHMGATAGFQASGYGWGLDVDFDYMTSVFDSRFLSFEYRAFLDQISYVPGVAAHAKAMRGPVSFVAEWNGAVNDAEFVDDLGNPVSIAPSAFAFSLAYQFDWNPTITQVGSQGTYLTLSFSESQDLAGVMREVYRVEPGAAAGDPAVTTVEQVRAGFVPQQRFSVGIGEWVTDGLRVAFEYTHIVDYSVAAGGTGRTGHGWVGMLTYTW